MFDFSETIESAHEPQGSIGEMSPRRPAVSETLRHSAQLSRCEELSGLSLTVIDPLQGRFVDGILRSLAGELPNELFKMLSSRSVHVMSFGRPDAVLYGLQLPGSNLIAGGVSLPRSPSPPDWVRQTAAQSGVSESELAEWLQRQPDVSIETARRLLSLALTIVENESVISKIQDSSQTVLDQLGMAYEQLALIQDLPHFMRPDLPTISSAELILQRVQLISDTELAAFVFQENGTSQYLLNGPWGLHGTEIEILIEVVLAGRFPRILVENNLASSSLDSRFSAIRSIVAVPLFESRTEVSWLVLGNPHIRPELGTEEANLLRSVSQILSAHSQINDLFREREEMTLSFIHSFVSMVEAKDVYTRGHSERVAIVARRIAEEVGLSKSDIQAIYHSGLLHDIGKIGVDDQVLRKPGQLTDEEFQKMSRHPEIGYRILRDLKNFENLLDGVLYHHERFDGRGYPYGLNGTVIPVMARVMAVADAYDAMRSDRPYRKGMSTTTVEDILEKGAGSQWDPEAVEAFFRVKDDISSLWERFVEMA